MKRTATRRGVADRDELRTEYRFDYRKARLNPYAERARKAGMVVVLDDEIARVFRTPESVKAVLRALIATMPAVTPKRRRHHQAEA